MGLYADPQKAHRDAHRRVMMTAFVVSMAFLISYLVYHAQVGSVRFQRTGTIRTVYLSILLTHTVLAATVPFLAGNHTVSRDGQESMRSIGASRDGRFRSGSTSV